MSMKKVKTIILFYAFFGALAPSQAQVNSDPSNPSSVGYSKKSGKAQSPWTFAGSTSAVRGLDYYAKIYMSYSLSAIYKLKNRQSLSSSLSYSAPLDGNVTFPEDWGVGNFSLSYTKSRAFKIFKKGNTSFRASLVLPTSDSTKRSSSRGYLSLSVPTSFMWKGTSLVVSPGLGLSSHKYKTANESGTRANSPLRIRMSLVASRMLYKKMSGYLSARYSTFTDYDFNFKQTQSLGVGLSVPVYKGASVTGGYSWSDRLLSNNAVFDDDRSNYFLSLSIVL